MYILLNSRGQITINGSTLGGERNTTISKLEHEGAISWTAQITASSGKDVRAGSIAVDSKGYVYIAGYADNPITFSPTTALVNGKQDLTGDHIFLAHTNPQGKFEAPILKMAKGASGEGAGGGITIDDKDNIFHTKLFTGTVSITLADNSTASVTSATQAGFLAKYKTRFSSIEWMHKMTATALWFGPALTFVPALSNNLFAVGSFKGDVSYQTTTPSITSKGELDILLARLKPSDGSIDWKLTMGSLNTVALAALAQNTSDPMMMGLVQAKANTTGIKTLGFPGPKGTTLTLQVGDKTRLQSFVGMLDIQSQPPHFKWINTIATPDGKNITIQGLAQKPGGLAAAIVDFDAADFQVGSNPVKSAKPSMLVALIDYTTGAFTKVFVATSTGAEPVRSDGIVYDKRRDVFHILGSFTTDVTIGGKTLTHPATHQRAFFLLNVKPDGTWSCPP